MKSIVNGKKYVFPATIDDESVLSKIESAVKNYGLDRQNIIYEEDVWIKNWFIYNIFLIYRFFYDNTI